MTLFSFLHEHTFGVQDEFFDKLRGHKNTPYTEVVEHVTAKLENGEHIIANPNEKDGLGVANLRFHFTDPSQWIEVKMGHMTFFRVYAELGNMCPLTENGDHIPCPAFHAVSVHRGPASMEDITLEYDIVKLPSLENYNSKTTPNLLYVSPHGLTDVTFNPSHTFNFNYPVTKIVVVFQTNVDTVSLRIYDNNIPLVKVGENRYEVDFGDDSVNFSSLHNNAVLTVETDGEKETRGTIYGYCRHSIYCFSGMAGMRFTK